MMKKKIIASLALLCCMLPAFPLSGSAVSSTEVVVLSVGQADAVIIMTAGHTVVIDTGEDEDGIKIVEYLQKRRIERIDALIITHYDKDHVGGADSVLRGMPVEAVYDANYESDSRQYEQYIDALYETAATRYRVETELTIELGTLSLRLMPTALELAKEDDNNHSLVISMTDGRHSFFFAADAEEARITELLENGLMHHDVIKMPHHGRDKKNLDALLDALTPSIALITDSDKNPAEEAVLSKLSTHGTKTYQTRNGDIRILSGETELTVTQ